MSAFPLKKTVEIDNYRFCVDGLKDETILSATFAIDGNESHEMKVGDAVISGNWVIQKIQGGLADTEYEVSVVITTSGGRVLYGSAVLPVY
jgi:hypothetical protein